jgi:UDP-N-acetylglucosamine--N-acetylmuramyl-(pentapeptide) pyrophosphoryl-undecaprenol N-acetylglucosamine transferase
VYLGFPEAEAALHHGAGVAYVDSGNPIEAPPSPRPTRDDARRSWGFGADVRRVLLVFGGSQGARGINVPVGEWLAGQGGAPAGLGVIWGTGKGQYEEYKGLESDRVRVRPYLSPIADAYAAADLAVARAGAMATAELCAWGVPMLLVPLPTAAADHQTANARALAEAGAAVQLPQREFSAERLAAEVARLLDDESQLGALAAGALARARPDAAAVIATRVLALARARTRAVERV